MKKRTETQLVRACLDLLAARGIFAWRNNTGAFGGEYKGKRWFVRAGFKGSSDIIGILPDGRFLAVECKVGKNKTTDDQDEFIENIRKNNGFACVVRSVEEMDGLIGLYTDDRQ